MRCAPVLVLLLASVALADRRQVAPRPAWAAAVAKFTWRTKRGRIGQGTAVLVGKGLAMTAYHCVKDWTGRGVLRFGFDGKACVERREAVSVAKSSPAGDWAILRLDKPIATIAPLKMAAQRVQKYDLGRAIVAGYSCDPGRGQHGRVLTWDAGCRIKKVRTPEGRLLTDAIAYVGASGGPVFVKDKDADRWHWVGLVQGNINTADRKNFVTYAVYQPAYAKALKEAIQ